MPETPGTARQWSLLRRWLLDLRQLPTIDVMWLEGSLARRQGNPSSDIDIRFGIADADFARLWLENREILLAGLGDYLILETSFARVLTAEGIIVEASAFCTSALDQLERYEWEFILNRLPTGQPIFQQLPQRQPAEVWPAREELSVNVVRRLSNLYILIMANSPAPLFNGELQSARFQLDDTRTELIQVMYRHLGLAYAKRFKHFSEIFPAEWLADLDKTYMPPGSKPLDPHALAQAYVALFSVLGKHLQLLSDKAGGGFEATWYYQLYEQVSQQFEHFINAATHNRP